MSIEYHWFCDADGCERNAHTIEADRPPTATFLVREGGGRDLHFCSWDCILKHAASMPPAEVIEA